MANATYPADFLSDNLRIQVNVLDAAAGSGRGPAAVPRLVLHLPQACARSRSARTRCSPARWSRPTTPTRSPRSPASCRSRRCAGSTALLVHLRDADQPLRPGRQLRPGRPRTSCPRMIRRFHEAQQAGAACGHAVGHRHAAAGVPARRRPGAGLPAPAGAATTTPEPINVGTGRGHHDPRPRRAGRRNRRLRRRDRLGHVEARRHAAQAARRFSPHEFGWKPEIGLTEVSAVPIGGMSTTSRRHADNMSAGPCSSQAG